MHYDLVRRGLPCLELFVCSGLAQHQLLDQTIEDFSDMSRLAPVEPKRDPIEIKLQVFRADTALTGAY